MIRKAAAEDLEAVKRIYEEIHSEEEAGRTSTGWLRNVYPTGETAEKALQNGELYVMEEAGEIVASGRINGNQEPEYALVPWQYPAEPDRVLVLHTLTISPRYRGQGRGRAFVAFYEALAAERGCTCLRLDTNARNLTARAMYKKLGFREAGVVPTTFNGIAGVALVCLEKQTVPR